MPQTQGDVQTIFGRALEIEARAERAAYLDEACGADTDLRAEVEGLLATLQQAGQFMAQPAAAAVSEFMGNSEPSVETTGTQIGVYKIREKIGEGGFGVVYIAEQEAPVRRKVALKIIKPGMDSDQVIARFESERQALAMMDHTNIAKVYDAGATASGRPYFVMELVHGVPITEYCDANKLLPRQRLELLVPVCHAIQHAHQKGIIHRDIKPSNILVTRCDDKPVPKVIDFGVAKAIEQRLTERTVHTQFGSIVGTFEYMSPEQAEITAFGVDTRSDIYSLGVVLYELLTGTTPLEKARLRAAAFDEIRRIIKEEEPPRPSERLSTSTTLATVAAARHTEPAKLARLIRGELDWVVMKCLEKDRTRRYETANELAGDIQRYLNDDPVQACPPSTGYRLRKWARRHKTLVRATVAVVAGMVLALAAVTWQWRLTVEALKDKELARQAEQQQRDRAEANWAATLIALKDKELARQAEQQQRDRAEANWTTTLIALADRDWVLGDVKKARLNLDLCPEKHRNDDWRQLHLACHAQIAAVKSTVQIGPPPWWSPDGKGFVMAGTHGIAWHDEGNGYRETILAEPPKERLFGAIPAVVGTDCADFTVTYVRVASTFVGGKRVMDSYSVGVWDPRAKVWTTQWPAWPAGNSVSFNAALSADGRLIAVALDHQVMVREIATGNVLFAIPNATSARALSLSPDGKWLAIHPQKQLQAQIWNVAKGILVYEREPPTLPVFSADGRYMAIYMRDENSAAFTAVWSFHEARIMCKLGQDLGQRVFSPDNRLLAVSRPGGIVRLWDLWQSRWVLTLRSGPPTAPSVARGTFSPDGQRLITVRADGVIQVWNLRPLHEYLKQGAGR